MAGFVHKDKLPAEYKENPEGLIDLPCVYRFFKGKDGKFPTTDITLVRVKINFESNGRLEVGDY